MRVIQHIHSGMNYMNAVLSFVKAKKNGARILVVNSVRDAAANRGQLSAMGADLRSAMNMK